MKNFKYSTQTINKKNIADVSKVLKSEFLTQGPKTEEFENNSNDMFEVWGEKIWTD